MPSNHYRFRVLAENVHGRSAPGLCSDDVQLVANNNSDNSVTSCDSHAMDDTNDTEITIRPGNEYKIKYQVQEELGKGKYGIVHRVVDNKTGQIMAAKTVKCIMAAHKQMVCNILNGKIEASEILICFLFLPYLQINEEIAIMRSLRHSKLLQLFAVFETQREIILILE